MLRITSCVGTEELPFGSTESDAIAVYGKPEAIRTNREGEIEYDYGSFIIRFEEHFFREITILPGVNAFVMEVPVAWDRSFFDEVCKRDGNPQECYGFIVLQDLCLALTGFHDDDRSQLAVTAFRKGDWDRFAEDMTPFQSETT